MAAKRVLIVDDDETFRIILRESLSKSGLEVEEAADGVQAVEAARRSTPDLVVVDIMMPGLDGVALCRELRSMEALKQTPLLVVTALADQKVLQDALRFGANDYLLKPADASALLAKIDKMLAPPSRGAF